MLNWIGWTATALFACSYFFKDKRSILGMQLFAALLWISYGTMLQALPVVVANAAVAVSATIALIRAPSPSRSISTPLS